MRKLKLLIYSILAITQLEVITSFAGDTLETSIDFSEESEESDYNYIDLGQFELTSYCSCRKCNGKWTGYPTKLGTQLTNNQTVAVDPNIIPLGSWIEIDVPGIGWKTFRAEDTGSGVKGNHIDIYVGDNHQDVYNEHYNTEGIYCVAVRFLRE